MTGVVAAVADWVLFVLGGTVIVLGVRGMPGARRLLARPGVRHTWRHGALVFAALTYAIVVPAVGALIVLQAVIGVPD